MIFRGFAVRLLAALVALPAALSQSQAPREASVHGRLLFGARAGVTLAGRPLSGATAGEAAQFAESLAGVFRREPVDAFIIRPGGEMVSEKPGCVLDVRETTDAVMNGARGEPVAPVFREVPAAITIERIRALKRLMGSFSTVIGGSAERKENIRLAARYLDKSLMAPGQVFSFLDFLGPTTYERGFVDAPVIVGEEFVLGPGGGVCQAATTVYNAALSAGLTIRERHRHTKPVGYVTGDRDAVVASWGLDLKIQNPYEYPVMLRFTAQGGTLSAAFLGPVGGSG